METVGELQKHLRENRTRLARIPNEGVLVLDREAWPGTPDVSMTCSVAPMLDGGLAILPPKQLYDHIARRFRNQLCKYIGAEPSTLPPFPDLTEGLLVRSREPSNTRNLERILPTLDPAGRLAFIDQTQAGPLDFSVKIRLSGQVVITHEGLDLAEAWFHLLGHPVRKLLGLD
jgi:hypothetical protein